MDQEENGKAEAHDPYYPPVVTLPEVHVPTGEDQEDQLMKLRAKLYRFDGAADPPEWKERGTGDVKLLQHKEKRHIRLVMRRDRTLKVCANHYIQPWMLLKPMKGSERAWMYLVQADYADDEAKAETLAIRFANADNAKKFKVSFDEAVLAATELEAEKIEKAEGGDVPSQTTKVEEKKDVPKNEEESSKEATEQLSSLSINK